MANTRIPYKSTVQLLQLDAEPAASPSWTVRGEKEWQAWAQDHNDWLDNQTKMANTRPPYNSTLQLSADVHDDHDTLALPKTVAVTPPPARDAVPLRGEKQWQEWAQGHVDALDNQTAKANTRLPYHSTLVQLDFENDDDLVDTDPVKVESNSVPLSFSFVHLVTEDGDELVKVEDNRDIPFNFRF